MKSPYIADLQPAQLVTGVFLVQSKDIRPKKTGEPYLALNLADRTGDIDAKMWDNVDKVIDTFERDDFVRVKGLPAIYQNKLQFTVHNLQRVAENEVELGDFFPASRRDPAEMFAELRGIIAGMANPHLRGLLNAIFDDPDIAPRYQRAPAAKTIHHAWLGGLIEHVLSLCTLCKLVVPHYPGVDMDLMLTGAILHDIGKIEELTYERSFNYSDAGQLIGHIIIGARIVDEKTRLIPGFPGRLKTLVEHLILSHHGELAFGSPKVPMCAEAMLLHHLDNLDSKMETIRGSIERDKLADGSWTTWVPSLERPILKKEKYLAPPPAAPAPVEPKPQPPQTQPASLFANKLKGALTGE